MRALVKLVCERCYVMYRGELEAEGWINELPETGRREGICSMCGRVEGHRTVQLDAQEIAALAGLGNDDSSDKNE